VVSSVYFPNSNSIIHFQNSKCVIHLEKTKRDILGIEKFQETRPPVSKSLWPARPSEEGADMSEATKTLKLLFGGEGEGESPGGDKHLSPKLSYKKSKPAYSNHMRGVSHNLGNITRRRDPTLDVPPCQSHRRTTQSPDTTSSWSSIPKKNPHSL
jgi:hypothetical protein